MMKVPPKVEPLTLLLFVMPFFIILYALLNLLRLVPLIHLSNDHQN